jgi:predicted ATPase
VPETIQGVLMARIDRLPAAAKQALQTAAVLGQEVAVPLLERL